MNDKYTLDFLIQTFEDHTIQSERNKAEYRSKNGEPTYDDSFNICKAFLTFAKEIKELKEKK